MLESGIKGTGSVTVVPENTAAACGSGTLQVFATPAMIALMEKTCLNSVAPFLEDGCGTVGTLLNVRHTAPTPLGMEVTCGASAVVNACFEQGVVLLSAGPDVVRFLPPFIISEKDVDFLTETLKKAVNSICK